MRGKGKEEKKKEGLGCYRQKAAENNKSLPRGKCVFALESERKPLSEREKGGGC